MTRINKDRWVVNVVLTFGFGLVVGIMVGLLVSACPTKADEMTNFWAQQNAHNSRVLQQQLQNDRMVDDMRRQMTPNPMLSPC